MVQELHVLRCFSCETFQSHIVKKTNKWECKICGVKQSIKKVYGRGSGKDCRIHTQKLNTLKGIKEETESTNKKSTEVNELEPGVRQIPKDDNFSSSSPTKISNKTSKWAEFVDENETGVNLKNVTKPKMNGFKSSETSKSSVQKRRMRNEFDGEEFGGCLNNVDAVDRNYSMFNNTCSSGYVKKRKSNEYCLAKNSSYNHCDANNGVDSGICNTQAIPNSRKTLDKACWQIDSKVSTKWASYLKEDETNSSKIPSQNSASIQKKVSKVSLKWAKYLEKEEDMISTGTSLVCTDNQSKSEVSLEYPEDNTQEEGNRNYLGLVPPGHFGGVPFDDHVSNDSSKDSGRVSAADLGRVSSDNFFLSNETVKRSAPNFNMSNYSVNISDSSGRESSYCDYSANSSFFDLNCYKNTNPSRNETLKIKCSNEVHNTDGINKEEEKFNTIPFLPVFEQASELNDSDFQLDF